MGGIIVVILIGYVVLKFVEECLIEAENKKAWRDLWDKEKMKNEKKS